MHREDVAGIGKVHKLDGDLGGQSRSNEQVGGFEIAMDEIAGVQIVQSLTDVLGHRVQKRPRHLRAILLKPREEISLRAILQDQDQWPQADCSQRHNVGVVELQQMRGLAAKIVVWRIQELFGDHCLTV